MIETIINNLDNNLNILRKHFIEKRIIVEVEYNNLGAKCSYVVAYPQKNIQNIKEPLEMYQYKIIHLNKF